MNREVLVDEEIDVLVRMMADGEIRPTSFLWRDRTQYVSEIGRQWQERVAGQTYRCFLIQAVDGNTYELRWEPLANVWSIHRAWLRDLAV